MIFAWEPCTNTCISWRNLNGKLTLGKLEEKLIIDSFTQKDSKWFGKITELGFANKQNGFWQSKTLIN